MKLYESTKTQIMKEEYTKHPMKDFKHSVQVSGTNGDKALEIARANFDEEDYIVKILFNFCFRTEENLAKFTELLKGDNLLKESRKPDEKLSLNLSAITTKVESLKSVKTNKAFDKKVESIKKDLDKVKTVFVKEDVTEYKYRIELADEDAIELFLTKYNSAIEVAQSRGPKVQEFNLSDESVVGGMKDIYGNALQIKEDPNAVEEISDEAVKHAAQTKEGLKETWDKFAEVSDAISDYVGGETQTRFRFENMTSHTPGDDLSYQVDNIYTIPADQLESGEQLTITVGFIKEFDEDEPNAIEVEIDTPIGRGDQMEIYLDSEFASDLRDFLEDNIEWTPEIYGEDEY